MVNWQVTSNGGGEKVKQRKRLEVLNFKVYNFYQVGSKKSQKKS